MSAMYDSIHIRGFEFTMDGRVILPGDAVRPRWTDDEEQAWAEWLDAPDGVGHYRPKDRSECDYSAALFCNKCGWLNPIIWPAKEQADDCR